MELCVTHKEKLYVSAAKVLLEILINIAQNHKLPLYVALDPADQMLIAMYRTIKNNVTVDKDLLAIHIQTAD